MGTAEYVSKLHSIFIPAPSGFHAIPFFNGLRAMSFLWVFYGHVFAFFLPFLSVESLKVVLRQMKGSFLLAILSGATYAVDTFFFMSGCLAAYNGAKAVRGVSGLGNRLKQTGVSILVRYTRLAVPLLIVILAQFLYRPHWSPTESGRTVLSISQSGMHGGCRRYWWSTLLMINTLIDGGRGTDCMSWTWYLANDFQFYLVTMVVVLIFGYNQCAGTATVGSLLVGSLYLSFRTAFAYDLVNSNLDHISLCGIDPKSRDSELLALAADIWSTPGFTRFYIAPWVRIQAYLIGVFLGLYLSSKEKYPTILSTTARRPAPTMVEELGDGDSPQGIGTAMQDVCSAVGRRRVRPRETSRQQIIRNAGDHALATHCIGNQQVQKYGWKGFILGNGALRIVQTVPLFGLIFMTFLPLFDDERFNTQSGKQLPLFVYAWSRCLWAVCIALLSVLAITKHLSSCLLYILSLQLWTPIANLSFSLYLCHPVIMILGYGLFSDKISRMPTGAVFLQFFFGSLTLSFFFAFLLYTLIEVPIRERGAKFIRYVRPSD